MAFLANRTVNLLNAHYGLLSLASRSGGVFNAGFLLNSGVSVPGVLCAYAAIFASRLFLRPLALMAGKRLGLRPIVMIGAMLYAGVYLILPHVQGVGPALFLMIGVSAVSDAFYWTGYHAYFAALGDPEHRGHQISAREALVAVIGVVAPIAGGFALVTFGPTVAFSITASIQAATILPLFGTPNVPVERDVDGAFRAALPGLRLFLADGWISSANYMVWSLTLFTALSNSYAHFGGAVALAALAGAAAGLLLGRQIDGGHGRGAVWIAFGSVALIVVAKAMATTSVLAVTVNTAAALLGSFSIPTLMTAVYNLSRKSPCPLRFQVASESGFDIGFSTGCLLAAGLITAGVSSNLVILLALLGALAQLVILRRYYRGIGADGFALPDAATSPEGP